jgi:hypothetical protein
MNFSRRKLRLPSPPSPALNETMARSMNMVYMLENPMDGERDPE